jgi:hypothetical protein
MSGNRHPGRRAQRWRRTLLRALAIVVFLDLATAWLAHDGSAPGVEDLLAPPRAPTTANPLAKPAGALWQQLSNEEGLELRAAAQAQDFDHPSLLGILARTQGSWSDCDAAAERGFHAPDTETEPFPWTLWWLALTRAVHTGDCAFSRALRDRARRELEQANDPVALRHARWKFLAAERATQRIAYSTHQACCDASDSPYEPIDPEVGVALWRHRFREGQQTLQELPLGAYRWCPVLRHLPRLLIAPNEFSRAQAEVVRTAIARHRAGLRSLPTPAGDRAHASLLPWQKTPPAAPGRRAHQR